MTWKYPVEVVITDRKAFSVAGVLGVLSSTLSNVKAAF